jgi:hypothetical protein
MGWWKIPGTEDQIGDIPLDALGDAVGSIVAAYDNEFGRKPTKAEWEAMLCTVLGNEMPEFQAMNEGIVVKVSIVLK